MIQVLRILESQHAIVVHGDDGLDELSLSGRTRVWELKDGSITEYYVTPADLGLPVVDNADIKIDSPGESAKLLEKVLSGDDTPAKYLVLANAGAALLAANRTESLIDGVNLAKQSIDTGSATKILESFIKLSNTLD